MVVRISDMKNYHTVYIVVLILITDPPQPVENVTTTTNIRFLRPLCTSIIHTIKYIEK